MVINEELGIDTEYKVKERLIQIYVEKEEDEARLKNPNVVFGDYILLPYENVSAEGYFNEKEIWRLQDYKSKKYYYFIPVDHKYNYFYTNKDTYNKFKKFADYGRAKGWFRK